VEPLGRTRWAIPGGRIPPSSTGREPAFTSHDKLCLLNVGAGEADVRVTVYYRDRAPVGPYRVRVPARRVKHVRFNDLIDPLAIPLDEEYAAVVESDVPIVVQFSRLDSGSAAAAPMGTIAFADDD
jgi:hypothetical protein